MLYQRYQNVNSEVYLHGGKGSATSSGVAFAQVNALTLPIHSRANNLNYIDRRTSDVN